MSTSQFDRDARKFNRAYAVRILALSLLRQDSFLTLAEAVARASALYDRGERPVLGRDF